MIQLTHPTVSRRDMKEEDVYFSLSDFRVLASNHCYCGYQHVCYHPFARKPPLVEDARFPQGRARIGRLHRLGTAVLEFLLN